MHIWTCIIHAHMDRLMDKGRREEGKDEINGESNMDAYTLTHVSR